MRKIAFLLLVLSLLLFPRNAWASEDFSIATRATYTLREDENTHAVFAITLTNKTDRYYASSYSIEVGFNDVRNVQAQDANGAIAPRLTKTLDGHKFELDFNARVTGVGNSLPFTLSFDTKDVVKRQGLIWEVNIPGLSDVNSFASFTTVVVAPKSFGTPTYIKPYTVPSFPEADKTTLRFEKEQLGKSGIAIAYGQKQRYAFTLFYHLVNKNVFPVRTEIALPPNTAYQEVLIESIKPGPIDVYEDEDGNWLAQYTLLPSQKKDITLKGIAEISLSPKKTVETEETLALYLKEKPYWQTSNPSIKKLAEELKTPAAIYQYLVKTLHYDYARVTENKPRLGAAKTLADPTSAVCLEFTDLFVTLARAAGIPAREVDGFAYTGNPRQRPLSLVKDILHAWPQYYDRDLDTWVMVDPTWGNTTGGVDYFNVFDFDHLTFVIKGKDSNYPIPAGGYKVAGGENQKDVDVTFSQTQYQRVESFAVKVDLPKTTLPGIPIRGAVILANTGNTILLEKTLHVTSTKVSPKSQKTLSKRVPPFGNLRIPLSFEKTPLLTNATDFITIAIDDRVVVAPIRVSPFTQDTITIGGVFVAVTTIIVLVLTKGARRVPFLR